MPLKSKVIVTDAAFGGGPRYLSNDPAVLSKSREGDEKDDVLFSSQQGLRIIELNRPKKLNALNGSMARKLIGRLKEYEKSQILTAILIKGAGRAFCAGGDVAALALWNNKGDRGRAKSADYFALEYKLDHLIASYSQPYIAFMDGITMGGGVGLSVHAPFRIATENTVFAMPETTIGFFPDVGASFFLPKLDGAMGMFLALTSAQLRGVDVFYHGIATHYLAATSLPDLEARLGELTFKDHYPLSERLSIINATIEEFATGLPSPRPLITGALRKHIDEIFAKEKPQDMLQDLMQMEQKTQTKAILQWAVETEATLRERSPTSVAVTARLMQSSRYWDIAEAFQHEYNIAEKFMRHHDFVEGVTARLVERKKTRPDWKPNELEDVLTKDVEDFFNEPPTLPLLNDGLEARYKEYPHRLFALPSEEKIRHVASGMNGETQKVVKHFSDVMRGKQGVKEKVEEVLERMR